MAKEIVHLGNEVMRLVTDKQCLFSMYEDADLEGHDRHLTLALWIATNAPGRFVVVTTGDSVYPACHLSHSECQGVYDPTYCIYIVAAASFALQAEDILARDRQWREDAARCQRVAAPTVMGGA